MRGFGQHQNTVSNARRESGARTSRRRMANNATLNFFADSKDGSAVPVNAQIFVGDYSARSTQIADTDPATVTAGTNATGNLDNTAQFVADGAGLAGRQERPLDVLQLRRGRTGLRPRALPGEATWRPARSGTSRSTSPTNYASATQGATITTDAPATGTNVTPGEPDRRQRGHEQHPELHADRHLPRAGERPLGRDQARRDPRHRRPINRLGVSAMFSSRFVGAPLVRRVRRAARARSAANPTCDGSIAARLDEDHHGAGRLVPGPSTRGRARRTRRCATSTRRTQTVGDAREVRGDEQPVHRSALLPGRPGPRSDQQRRVPARASGAARCTPPRSRCSAQSRPSTACSRAPTR